MQNLKFVKLEFSKMPGKLYDAIFTYTKNDKPKEKRVGFGSKEYEQYVWHKDIKRRDNYRARHKNDYLENPLSPGALSWYILWNKPSLKESIKDYKSHFNV